MAYQFIPCSICNSCELMHWKKKIVWFVIEKCRIFVIPCEWRRSIVIYNVSEHGSWIKGESPVDRLQKGGFDRLYTPSSFILLLDMHPNIMILKRKILANKVYCFDVRACSLYEIEKAHVHVSSIPSQNFVWNMLWIGFYRSTDAHEHTHSTSSTITVWNRCPNARMRWELLGCRTYDIGSFIAFMLLRTVLALSILLNCKRCITQIRRSE